MFHGEINHEGMCDDGCPNEAPELPMSISAPKERQKITIEEIGNTL